MAQNSDWYPSNFTSSIPGKGDETHIRIFQIEKESRISALRTLYRDRKKIQSSISIQNIGITVYNGAMPLLLSASQVSEGSSGTIAFVFGKQHLTESGSTVEEFDLDGSHSVVLLGEKLGKGCAAPCAFGDTVNIFISGGRYSYTGFKKDIESLRIASRSLQQSGAVLSDDRAESFSLASSTYGFTIAGISRASSAGSKIIDELSFSQLSVSVVGDLPVVGREGSGSGVGDSHRGIVAGVGQYRKPINSIFEFSYSSRSLSTLGNTLSVAKSGVGGGSNGKKAIFVGGGTSAGSRSPTNTIEEFLFANDSISTSGSTLSRQDSRLSAASSSSDGFFCGGRSQKRRLEKVNFQTVTPTNVGDVLSIDRDQSASCSDYSPAF